MQKRRKPTWKQRAKSTVVSFYMSTAIHFCKLRDRARSIVKRKAVVVAGDPKERKGVVLAANYIAKQRFGIYTTMPLWEAKKDARILLY